MGKASRKKKDIRTASLAETVESDEIGRPEWSTTVEAAARRESLSATLAGLSARRVLKPVFKATDRIVDRVTEAVDRNFATGRIKAKTACREGCDHCCHVDVGVNTTEIIAIAEHVDETFSPADREALLTRVRTRNARKAQLPPDQRTSLPLPCPFLVNSRCTIYSVRPMSCRILHSTDPEPCRRTREGEVVMVPVILDYGKCTSPVRNGYVQSQRDAGRHIGPLWLSEAVETALTDPDAVQDWRDGGHPFESAMQGVLTVGSPDTTVG